MDDHDPGRASTRRADRSWDDFATDGRLDPVRRSAAAGSSGEPIGPPGGDRRARAGRAARHPVRDRLGPARRRVRGRPAVVEALHPRLGPDRSSGPSTSPRTPSPEARVARGDRGLAGADPRLRIGPTGTRRRCSTSSTSSSTAARSGRPARSVARSRSPTTPAGSRCSSASTTRSTTRSTSTSTPRSRSCGSFPELERRGIRDLLGGRPGRRSGDRHDRGVRARRGPRKVGGTVPHDVGGPDDDPFYRPNWYRFQDVNELEGPRPEVRPPGLARRRRRPSTATT